MRELRSDLRSEHERYAECEHHLALEETQLQLQLVRNEGLQSQLMTTESRLSEETSSEASGMRDIRTMGLRSELHMKQSLLDRMQQQLTDSKNQYHELSCQQARQSSLSDAPSHALYYEMYNKHGVIMILSRNPKRKLMFCIEEPKLKSSIMRT